MWRSSLQLNLPRATILFLKQKQNFFRIFTPSGLIVIVVFVLIHYLFLFLKCMSELIFQILPTAFLHIAQGLKKPSLRCDYRQRLLIFCMDVSTIVESRLGRHGADYLGPLLPAIAEICSDLLPMQDVDTPLLKLFRNLWFYIVLYGLAPPIYETQQATAYSSRRGSLNVVQKVSGPYGRTEEWSNVVIRLAQSTPPLAVTLVKWLEDEVELIALYSTNTKLGKGHERSVAVQRDLLSAAIGGWLGSALLKDLAGVKATYLLVVAFLEILWFSHKGGVIKTDQGDVDLTSLLTCLFKYMECPNLPLDLHQCFTAIVHCAFDAAIIWLEKRVATCGAEVVDKEEALVSHACFLIKHGAHREESVRKLADSLLIQLRDKFPQLLWNGQCLEALLRLLSEEPGVRPVDHELNPISWSIMYHMHLCVKEWLTCALFFAPCTAHGLVQEYIRRVGTWQKMATLLSEIMCELGNSGMASVPAVVAATAAATGDGMSSANVKSMELMSMKRLLDGNLSGLSYTNATLSKDNGSEHQSSNDSKENVGAASFLTARFVQEMQQYLMNSQLGQTVNGEQCRATCLQASALLLSNTGASGLR